MSPALLLDEIRGEGPVTNDYNDADTESVVIAGAGPAGLMLA
jgi:NADPH-dependent 2,4-dienoyl-CoA reductase/sulfur reductase-like enzyme